MTYILSVLSDPPDINPALVLFVAGMAVLAGALLAVLVRLAITFVPDAPASSSPEFWDGAP